LCGTVIPKQKIIRGIGDKNPDTIGGLSNFLGLLISSDNAPLLFSKGRGASPLPLRPVPVPVPVCAALLCWMGGFGGSCNEKAPADFGRSGVDVLKLFDG